MIIKQKEKRETKERKTTCTYWYSKVLMCTFLSISYKNVLYKGAIVYIFHIVCCVCCVYSTWHTVIDTFIHYFILFCSIIQSMFQELIKK